MSLRSASSMFRLFVLFSSRSFLQVQSTAFRLLLTCRYDVTVTCTDGGRPPLTSHSQLTVDVTDVNDNSPRFVGGPVGGAGAGAAGAAGAQFSAEVLENNFVGVVVAQLSATDADIDENGRIAYRLAAESQHAFSVDPETGAVAARVSLDRERAARHRIAVFAVDGGSPPRTATAVVDVQVVDVNDERPKFLLPVYTLRVAENRPAGTSVGAVSVRDDDGDPFNCFRFRFAETGTSSAAAAFAIDVSSGHVTTRRTLDREQQEFYHLVAVVEEVKDSASSPPAATGLSSTATINVQVCHAMVMVIVLFIDFLPFADSFSSYYFFLIPHVAV